MKILILGYGYGGYYCAKKLLDNGHQVVAVSRTYSEHYILEQLKHVCSDIRSLNLDADDKPDAILYCAPPPPQGVCDTLLGEVLDELVHKNLVANIVYWGSSGVYGDHAGRWVDEESTCHITSDIQRRRLDAEAKIQLFAKTNQVPWSIMRVAGMFGPGRMPSTNQPVIYLDEAPYSNLVYIEDVAQVALHAFLHQTGLGIVNVSDGMPKKMGTLQRMVAAYQDEAVIEQHYEDVMATASPMKRHFLVASKQLSNQKLQRLFPEMNFSDFEKKVKKCLTKLS
ncbi:MAG: NAD-dependent epimerase/dehydratase family protein [Legionella sp.]|jgi:nucleoside-diphosphate-sugar epimerase|nr:NAD-dependent epimerase/dehydratase family protein [Legionella sp.]